MDRDLDRYLGRYTHVGMFAGELMRCDWIEAIFKPRVSPMLNLLYLLLYIPQR